MADEQQSEPDQATKDVSAPAQESAASPQKPKTRRTRRLFGGKTAYVLLVAVLAAALGFFVYKYFSQQKQIRQLSNPQAGAQAEQQQLIDTVGKLVELPKGENPTVATVSDADKLKSQAFFANAQNGDKVLIYSQSKQAILYRPSTNKVIQISSVSLDAPQQ